MPESKDELAALKSLLAGERALEAPSIEPLVPDVRSGVTFGLGTGTANANVHIDTVVVIWGYDVPFAMASEFKAWLSGIELQLRQEVANRTQNRVRYMGTYAASITSLKGAGRYRTFWSCNTMNDLAELGVAMAEPNSPALDTIWKELMRFRDRNGDESTEILVVASEARRL